MSQKSDKLTDLNVKFQISVAFIATFESAIWQNLKVPKLHLICITSVMFFSFYIFSKMGILYIYNFEANDTPKKKKCSHKISNYSIIIFILIIYHQRQKHEWETYCCYLHQFQNGESKVRYIFKLSQIFIYKNFKTTMKIICIGLLGTHHSNFHHIRLKKRWKKLLIYKSILLK